MSPMYDPLALVIGTGLAIVVGIVATVTRLDRDRAVYPVTMVVIAAYYVLFAIESGSSASIVAELTIASGYVFAALFGFKRSLWVVAAALAAHGIMDVFHGDVVVNTGVPSFWPPFCSTYDVTAAAYLAWRLTRGTAVVPQPSSVTSTGVVA